MSGSKNNKEEIEKILNSLEKLTESADDCYEIENGCENYYKETVSLVKKLQKLDVLKKYRDQAKKYLHLANMVLKGDNISNINTSVYNGNNNNNSNSYDNVYVICGHGSDLCLPSGKLDIRPVPKDCVYVTFTLCGLVNYVSNEMFEKFHNPENLMYLKDPVKYKSKLEQIFDQKLHIHYPESENETSRTYVNNEYNLININSLKFDNNVSISGVVPIPLYKDSSNIVFHTRGKYKLYDIKDGTYTPKRDVIDIVYKDAIYPTKKQLELLKRKTYSDPNKIFYDPLAKITQSELFNNRPGIYYNILCRVVQNKSCKESYAKRRRNSLESSKLYLANLNDKSNIINLLMKFIYACSEDDNECDYLYTLKFSIDNLDYDDAMKLYDTIKNMIKVNYLDDKVQSKLLNIVSKLFLNVPKIKIKKSSGPYISIGDYVSDAYAIKKDGTVITWPSDAYGIFKDKKLKSIYENNYKGLGISKDNTIICFKGNDKAIPKDLKIKDVAACYGDYYIVIDENDILLEFGKDKFDNFPGNIKVKKISCGSKHCLAIKDDDTLIMWGSNKEENTVNFPGNIKVKDIGCMNNRSIAVNKDGKVIFWGLDGDHKDNKFNYYYPEDIIIKKIAVRNGNIIDAITEEGNIISHHLNDITPMQRMIFKRFKAVDIFSKYNFGLALNEKGEMIQYGSNKYNFNNFPEYKSNNNNKTQKNKNKNNSTRKN